MWNTPWAMSYQNLWHARFASALLAQHRVNDGLTVTSFLLVGLHTKRELLFGESALLRQASLPVQPGSAVWSFTR